MQVILLSGGSGKRLWPLSGDVRSKQFLQLFKTPDGERYESMLQRMYRGIKTIDSHSGITIATSEAQQSIIREQLQDESVGISVEPCRRDTFPAIALATAYLHDEMGVSLDESVVVCPVDPYVDDSYFEALRTLSDLAQRGESNLTLMGIEPTGPSEKYGYIIPCSSDPVSAVKTFKEKPSTQLASEYISQGALWNGGVFAYRLGYVLERAHELIEFTDYQDLFDRYETLTKISFDYAVVEHEPNISVMRFSGRWSDLGTWEALTDAMEVSTLGEAVVSDSCSNVRVVNALGTPIICNDLKDVVVVASEEGILVTSLSGSSAIKPLVDQLESL